ncbi:MAG: S8 family serine peptidase [Chloroflexota bacterium]
MKKHAVLRVFVLAFLSLTLTFLPVGAAQTDVPPPAQSSQPNTAELIAQAVENGHVRVIVALNMPFQAQADVSAAQADSQRILIQQTQQQVSALLAGTDSDTVATFETIPYLTIDADATAIQTLSQSGLVRQIIKENVLYPMLAQSVPHIGAPAAWAAGYDGTGQVVAILDSGIESNHPFLTGKVIAAAEACYSLYGGTKVALCPGGSNANGLRSQTGAGSSIYCTIQPLLCLHGTHVAGIAAGANGVVNAVPINGVAKGAKIISVQVFHGETDDNVCAGIGVSPCIASTDTEILKGLEWVYQKRTSYTIAAVNLSLGGGHFAGYCDAEFPYYYDMFAQLRAAGIAVIAGTGNERATDSIYAPACISNAISVGATGDTNDNIWDDSFPPFAYSGSNSVGILDLLAPGENITSSIPGGVYEEHDGTSMATPHVTGAFAILRSAKPTATVDQILTALQDTGVPVTDPENGVIAPRIQVDAAATELVGNNVPIVGKIFINEIRVESNQAVELFNAGTSSVTMTGWKFIPYAGNGNAETTFTFPTFTLNAGSYVILNRGTGSNTATNLYLGSYSTAWASNGSGAALLKSHNVGIDFVRWGTSTLMPPGGTSWTGQNQNGPPSGKNLGRDPLTGDTDDGGDWSAQAQTLGSLNQPTRPANDNFANNTLVPGLPFSTTLATFTATLQGGEPKPTCSADIGRTVWYRYTQATTALVGFDTVGSDFDTSMAVYTGTWGALSEVGCSEDITLGTFPQSKVVLTANAGVTYYIQVGGYNAIGGHLEFNVDIPALNDDFSGAVVISSLPYTKIQDTSTSTDSPDDPGSICNYGYPLPNTVWFRYTAPASETIRFETTNSDYDTMLSVWTGTQGHLTEVDCSDDQDIFGFDVTSLVEVPVSAGVTYYIMIGSASGPSGNLIFKAKSLTPPPPGLNPPVLDGPDDGASVNTLTPKFSWDLAFNATSYEIQIGTTPTLTSDPIPVIGKSYTPLTPLLTTTYYWRVRSLGTGGAISAWTAPTRSVIIASAANAAPVQNFDRALPVRLTWSPINWAVQYEVQVDTEKTFANPRLYDLIVSGTTLFYQFNAFNNGTYYWRVRALDSHGNGTWGTPQTFIVNTG